MKRLAIIFTFMFLTGCTTEINSVEPITSEIPVVSESSAPDSGTGGYIPLNYTKQTALWVPYMRFEEILYGKSEGEYRSELSSLFSEAAEQGINTVYFHVHPNGDAYYISDIFPRGVFWDGDYDPLETAVKEAHSHGISIHAWINPIRMQREDEMSQLPDTYIAKQWSEQPEKGFIRLVGERWYLVPAYNEVRELVCAAAEEILDRYEVDGIHIDDYFYPTKEESFDKTAYEESGAAELAEWRRGVVTSMVRSLCDTVHSHGKRYKFGISPQGNIGNDYSNLYADVELWSTDTAYCDYIAPQLYYGFLNETCPFEPVLHSWEKLTENGRVSLIVGLAEYKVGTEDKWAGEKGKDEWVTCSDVLERQIELVRTSSADGYALYR